MSNPAQNYMVDAFVAAFDQIKPKLETLQFSTNVKKTHVKDTKTFLMDLCTAIVPLALAGYTIMHILQRMDPDYNKKQQSAVTTKQLLTRLKAVGRTLSSPLDSYEQMILNDVILPNVLNVTFNDIGGLDAIKQELYETVILPLQSPELFTAMQHNNNNTTNSLLSSPRGVLFYGPPGTGKTMMAKAIAKSCRATFINVRLSTLQNKYFGESSKIVRAVFTLAVKLAPSILFIDEIDLFMPKRSGSDNEGSIALRAEFMSLWDGLTTSESAQVTVLGCTNRPFDIDEAILRRMPRSFLFDLPDVTQRVEILNVLLRDQVLDSSVDIAVLAKHTEKYSGSDLKELCRYAAMIPVRELLKTKKHLNNIHTLNDIVHNDTTNTDKPRAISVNDFNEALQNVEPTGQSALEYSKNFQKYHGTQNTFKVNDVVDKFVDFVASTNNTPQPNKGRQSNGTSAAYVD